MYHNILLPVAFDRDHSVSAPVKLAGILASSQAKITFLHVVDLAPAYVMSYISERDLRERREALGSKMKQVAELVPGAIGSVIEGHPGRTIVDFASQYGCDVIIIASHRPELKDYFLGSTAAYVVRHAPSSVHVSR